MSEEDPNIPIEKWRSYRTVLQKTANDHTRTDEEDGTGHKNDDGGDENGGNSHIESFSESDACSYGRVCGIYRSVRDDKFPTERERETYRALHRRNYGRNNEPWRKFEWGEKPKGFREWRDYHYIFWRRTYLDYLIVLHKRFMKKLNSYKDFSKKKISLEKFIDFAYLNSSGYITQYA
jgi:hypothetical protein